MPSFVIFAILAAVAAIIVLGLLAGPRLFRGTRPVRVPLRCPERREDVRVEFRVTAWEGSAVDVTACSVFTPGTAVACGKVCLR